MAQDANTRKLEPLRLLEDEPVPDHTRDELGLLPFAQTVAEAALGTPGPFTIGVFGDWGTGKTSLLRQAKSLIDAQDKANVVTVWFNAWQYEKEEHLIVPLLLTIGRELAKRGCRASSRRKAFCKKGATALQAIAYGFSIPGFFSGQKAIDREAQIEEQKKLVQQSSFYFETFDQLQKLGDAGADGDSAGTGKIVVFVDDLDRCMPENAIKLLEGIKLVLAQPGFVFVLALNRAIINGYLAKRYNDEYGVKDADLPKSYLDKIVQLPLLLPSHQQRFEDYISGLLARKDLGFDEKMRQALADLKAALSIGSDYNPRVLVRTINNLLVDWRLYEGMREVNLEDMPKVLGVCLVSRILQQHMRPKSYRCFVRDNVLCARIAKNRRKSIEIRFPERSKEAAETERERPADPRDDIRADLVAKSFLVDLLDTEPGQLWLANSELRVELDEFIARQEPEVTPAAGDPVALVEGAIRRALSMGPDTRVSESDRKRVTSLDLGFPETDDKALAELHGLENLQHLRLVNARIGDSGLSVVAKFKKLRKLDLKGTEVTDQGLPYVAKLEDLRNLNLSKTQVSDIGVRTLTTLTRLEQLVLNDTSVTDAGADHLCGLTSLRELLVGRTGLSDEGLRKLMALHNLRRLDIYGTNLTDSGLEAISPLSSLRRLDIAQTQVGDAGLQHLVGLEHMEILVLTGLNVHDEGLKYISRLQSLQLLLLNSTQIGDKGVEHLLGLRNLHRLDIGNTNVTDTALGHVAALKNLRRLDVGQTHVTDNGLARVARLEHLEELIVTRTNVGDQGLAHVAQLTNLLHLYLSHTSVADDGLRHLTGLRHLRRVELVGTHVSEEGLNRLQKALPNCTIIR